MTIWLKFCVNCIYCRHQNSGCSPI